MDKPPVVYLRLRKYIKLPKGRTIYLTMIAQMCADPEWEERLKQLVIVSAEQTQSKQRTIMVDMMQIIGEIKQLCPHMNIEYLGEPHVLIEFEKLKQAQPKLLWIVLVWMLLFMGSGLAIMNFHADVSMAEVHQKIYYFVTGKENPFPLIMQIPYSFGLGLGMILFFNRILKKKMNNEPDPLELEMFNYQENINHYVITEEIKKNHRESRNADE